MSAWSGIAVGAIALALAFVMAGQAVWEWRYNGTGIEETWTYGLFGATHTNTSSSLNTAYAYPSIPGQPGMGGVFRDFELWFLLGGVACVAGLGLSVATLRKKLRGLYAGIAFLGGCAAILFAGLDLILTIPRALGDLPVIGGQPIANFQGQLLQPGGTGAVLSWGPALGWYLALGMGLVLAWGASDMWGLRIPAPAPARVAVPKREVVPPPPPPPTDLVQEHVEPVIEEVFVIAPNGLLVKHMSRTLMSDKDRDVVGGMIAVVSSFVRETFTEHDAGAVQEVTLGENRFIIANDRGLVAAALVSHGEKEDVEHRLLHLLTCLRDRYGDRLERWGGEPLEGIEDELAVLWEPFFAPPPPTD